MSRVLQWSVLVGVITLIAGALPAVAADKKPNILFIVADDLGWKDVGFHGSDIRTPNIDNLAAGGAKLEQFYVQPMCTPTRASLMTGAIRCATVCKPASSCPPTRTACRPTNGCCRRRSRKPGYKTAIVGKWHLGHGDTKYWPRQRGF